MENAAVPAGIALSADPPRLGVMIRSDRVLAEMGAHDRLARDCLLALGWVIVDAAVLVPVLGPLGDTLGVTFTMGETAAVLILTTLQALALSLRRVRPVACLMFIATVQLALVAVLPHQTIVRVAAPLVAAYTLGTCLPAPRLLRSLAAVLILEVAGGAIVSSFGTSGARMLLFGSAADAGPAYRPVEWVVGGLLLALLYATPAVCGYTVATRRDYTRLLAERATILVREQATAAAIAVSAERSRMARELHDIAAHHLSGLVVQAAAAERLIDHDPAAAKQATRSIRAQGKETLNNLRLAVGVLREQPPRAGRSDTTDGTASGVAAPTPGLAVLDQLMAEARVLGDDVTVIQQGRPYELSPIADVTTYRVVQESLANARQHAPGEPVHVRLHYSPTALRLQVENSLSHRETGDHSRSGYGLLGMRERADLTGARFSAGLTGDDRWTVELEMPHSDRPSRRDSALAAEETLP